MTSPSLLIVDDIENNRVALTMRLELAGYNVVTTANLTEEDHRRLNGGVAWVLQNRPTVATSFLGSCAISSRSTSTVAVPEARSAAMTKILYVEDNEDNIYMLSPRLNPATEGQVSRPWKRVMP